MSGKKREKFIGADQMLLELQDVYASCGLTLSRSTLDYNIDPAHEVTKELNKLMLSRFLAEFCVGFDDTHRTLIMPKKIPNADPNKTDPATLRLTEKMKEAIKEGKDSLYAKMWGYTSFDASIPYDIFDFRVSRHRDGPETYPTIPSQAGSKLRPLYAYS